MMVVESSKSQWWVSPIPTISESMKRSEKLKTRRLISLTQNKQSPLDWPCEWTLKHLSNPNLCFKEIIVPISSLVSHKKTKVRSCCRIGSYNVWIFWRFQSPRQFQINVFMTGDGAKTCQPSFVPCRKDFVFVPIVIFPLLRPNLSMDWWPPRKGPRFHQPISTRGFCTPRLQIWELERSATMKVKSYFCLFGMRWWSLSHKKSIPIRFTNHLTC